MVGVDTDGSGDDEDTSVRSIQRLVHSFANVLVGGDEQVF